MIVESPDSIMVVRPDRIEFHGGAGLLMVVLDDNVLLRIVLLPDGSIVKIVNERRR